MTHTVSLNGNKMEAVGTQYIKYSNGLLIQWGRAHFPSMADGGKGFATVKFPVAYKSADDYFAIASAEYANSGQPTFMVSTQKSAASLTIYGRSQAMGQITTADAEWVTFGRWK